MGYTRSFFGSFKLSRPLTEAQAAYLQAFAETRRMQRDPPLLAIVPDPLREATGLPLGPEGGFFIGDGELQSDDHPTVVDGDEPPAGQPGLWCRWTPTGGGTAIEWSGIEKFYHHVEWLEYLCDHFLGPWGYTLQGQVDWVGQDGEQQGTVIASPGEVWESLPKKEDEVAVCHRLFHRGHEQQRIGAARILMTYPGPHQRLAVAVLRESLEDPSSEVRLAVMEALENYPEDLRSVAGG